MPSTRNTRRKQAEQKARFRLTIQPYRSLARALKLSVIDPQSLEIVTAVTLGDGRVDRATVVTPIPGLSPYPFALVTVHGFEAKLLVEDILGVLDFAATRRTPAPLAVAA